MGLTTTIGAMAARWTSAALAGVQGIALAAAIGLQSSLEAAFCAEPAVPSTSSAACEDAQTTAAMRACENARYRKADAAMTAEYQALLSRLDAAGQAKLRAAQGAWLKFRDAEASFQADMARGGTLAPLLRTSTLADLTESRLHQLAKAAEQADQ